MTMSANEKPTVETSQPSARTSAAVGTSRCESSIVSPVTFAQRTWRMRTSPRASALSAESRQKRPSRSGNAATAWLPVVRVRTRPFARRRSTPFSTMRTLARAESRAPIPRSKTNVSSPTS